MLQRIFLFGLLSVLLGCQTETTKEGATATAQTISMKTPENGLSDIWYQGKAELNTYELTQNRYRDQHPGSAVLVFVTEDFLTDKQVKNDRYVNPNSTSVLKTNYIRRFTTGIYDYSIMTSVFTPTDTKQFPNTMKVTTSVQDWCGQAFMQINQNGKNYDTQIRSYFEGEGDQNQTVRIALLEDELFNRVRMGPQNLPTGEVNILPGTAYVRLAHKPFRVVGAEAALTPYTGDEFEGDDLLNYQIDFASGQRTLSIVFSREAPYRIEGWIDAYPSAFDKKERKTIARRKSTIWSPYWEQNAASDARLRNDLGLKGF